ncbi:unnamed protein product [Brassica oleracea]
MDPGRKYEKCVSNNTNKWKCIFCMKETNEGISRLKHHLVGGNTSITVCPNCPEHVRAELQNDAAYKMLDRQAMSVQPFPSTNDFDVEVDDAESKEEDNLEIYDDPVYDEYECESEEDLYKEIYGPPIFDIYEDDVVGDEGMSPRRLIINHIRRRWNYQSMKAFLTQPYLMAKTIEVWERFIILFDGYYQWKKRKKEEEKDISFTTAFRFEDESLLHGETDAAYKMLDRQVTSKLYTYLMLFIYGKLLEGKRPNLYWTPCAAHCLDLMLEDIGKLEPVKNALKKCIFMSGYIYYRVPLVNMMRRFTNQHNLHRPAVTRFATSFITMSQFHIQQANLKKMVTSDDWNKSEWPKEA